MSVNLIEELRRLKREHRAAYSKLATERDALLVTLEDLKADCAVLRQAYDLSCATSSRLAAKLTEAPAQSVAELRARVELLTGQNARMLSALDGNDDEGADAWIGEDGKVTDSCLAWMRERCAQSVAHIEVAAVARAVIVLAADRLKKGIVDMPRCEIEGALLRKIADDWGKAGPYGDHAKWARGLADRIESGEQL
jgi:hypothetical protein